MIFQSAAKRCIRLDRFLKLGTSLIKPVPGSEIVGSAELRKRKHEHSGRKLADCLRAWNSLSLFHLPSHITDAASVSSSLPHIFLSTFSERFFKRKPLMGTC